MNEHVNSLFFGFVAVAAVTYFGFKVRQDRKRLKRIVGVIDDTHTFELNFLLRLADSGQLSDFKTAGMAAS
jgi:hypothetical protein